MHTDGSQDSSGNWGDIFLVFLINQLFLIVANIIANCIRHNSSTRVKKPVCCNVTSCLNSNYFPSTPVFVHNYTNSTIDFIGSDDFVQLVETFI